MKDSEIKEVDNFCYLGIMFKYKNKFQVAIENNTEKARQALLKILTETSDYDVTIQTKMFLIYSVVLPILTNLGKIRATKI